MCATTTADNRLLLQHRVTQIGSIRVDAQEHVMALAREGQRDLVLNKVSTSSPVTSGFPNT